MSKREKMLALIVGSLVLLQCIFWVATSVQKSFRTRRNDKMQAQSKIDQQELILRRAIAADRDIREYKTRSLPSDITAARSEYEKWLAELLANAKLVGSQFKCSTQPKRNGTKPVQITWKVSGTGRLDQVTKMLYDYYSLDTLHRMSALKLTSNPENRDLKISFDTQVFVLAEVDEDQKFDPTRKSAWAKEHTLEDVAQIVQRNILSRANKPPQLARLSAQKVTLGKSLEFKIKASDPDENDLLSYYLIQPIEGAKVDRKTGRMTWRPKEVGEFSFVAEVEDDGLPAKSDMREFVVNVVAAPPPPPKPDPPKPAPKVDEAMFTYATGGVRVNGEPQIFLKVRTSGKTLKLKEGDAVKVGSVDGVISKINGRTFELTVGETKREIKRGDPLVSPSKPSADKPADETKPVAKAD